MPEPFVLLEPGALDGHGAEEVALPVEVARHLRTVRRLRPGDAVVLADGAGTLAPAQLLEAGARLTGPPRSQPRPRPTVEVLQGLPKGRKLDEVVRTLTELGVDRITPVATERSVTRLTGAKREKAVQRWAAVARAAGEQSRRAWLPEIDPPVPVGQVLHGWDEALVVAAHVGARTPLATGLLPLEEPGAAPGRVVVAVGPEGGWSPEEAAEFGEAGAAVVGLGETVLRTEHAAPAVVAVVSYLLGRLG